MQKIPEQYVGNSDFQDFLINEFDHTATHATMEELAEFAFGSLDKAIEKFEKHKGN